MRMAERISTAVYAMLLTFAFVDPTSGYAKNPVHADTFEPGQKHTCVPANQGWRCVPADQPSDPSVADDSSGTSSPATALDTNTANATAVATKNDNPTPPRSAGELPSYLNDPNARNDARYDALHAEPTKSAKATDPSRSRDIPPKSAASASNSSVPIEKLPPATGSASTRPADIAADTEAIPNGLRDNNDFLALPGNRYVVELAHGNDPDGIMQLANAVGIPAGQLYRLHFTHNKTNAWMLVWASYESINAARSAFANLPNHGLLNAGWSRRIAPLQAELRPN